MATYTKSVDVFGDNIEVLWDGNTWVSPSNGQQHASAADAMRVEIERYFTACGEDIEDEATAEEIDNYLEQVA